MEEKTEKKTTVIEPKNINSEKKSLYPQLERWVKEDKEVYVFGFIPAKIEESNEGYYITLCNKKHILLDNYGSFDMSGQRCYVNENKDLFASFIFSTGIAELKYSSKESIDILIEEKSILQDDINEMDKIIQRLNSEIKKESHIKDKLERNLQKYEDNEQLIETTIKLRVLSAINDLIANMNLTNITK